MDQTIYFDEAGFTGNKLLDKEQPYFTYAGIALTPDEAESVAKELKDKFRIQSDELKGSRLIKTVRGKKAISWLIENYNGKAQIIAFHKKYNLACKFFEYIFEPVLASQSSIFYNIGFHRFIASFLYICFTAKDETVLHILNTFEETMRKRDGDMLSDVLSPVKTSANIGDPIGQILTFALCHKDTIASEISSLDDKRGADFWVLDLSTTALFTLLAFWSENFDCLDVYCDESKPIKAHDLLFNVMVGRQDKVYQEFGGKKSRITFNLRKPIELVNSKDYYGIQIADIFASCLAYTMKKPEDDYSKEWLPILRGIINDKSVFPDLEYLDLEKEKSFINTLILLELVERTVKGKNLFDEIPAFIEASKNIYKVSICHH